jgi:hypothetical protein
MLNGEQSLELAKNRFRLVCISAYITLVSETRMLTARIDRKYPHFNMRGIFDSQR